MRGVRFPRRPGKVLTTSLTLGLSSTLALARERASGKNRPLYSGRGRIQGMVDQWNKARRVYRETVNNKRPDASALIKSENNIRKSFERIMLKTSVRYGNTETKRQRGRRSNRKYLNRMWDYAGARIRDIGMEKYPFPRPGTSKLESGEVILCYHGSSTLPRYTPKHPHMPELDFMDMIRSHLMELCRQCFRYGVPYRAAKRYVDNFIWRLIPFLDYVYTERKVGKPHFVKEGVHELREIVKEIRALYGTRNGRAPSITESILETSDSVGFDPDHLDSESDYDEIEQDVTSVEAVDAYDEEDVLVLDEDQEEVNSGRLKDLFNNLLKRCELENNAEWKEHIEFIRGLLDNKILTQEDTERLLQQVTEESRQVGVALHEFLSYGLPSPFNLSAPVYHGDEMAYDDSGLLLVSEMPVAGGRGRSDLVLFRRKILTFADDSPHVVVYEPRMVIDIKTKSAFNLDLFGLESTSKEETTPVVANFYLKRRRLTDEEWKSVVKGVPSPYERTQLQEYANTILSEYRRIVRADTTPPDSMIQAVLVIDSKTNWRKARESILDFVTQTYAMVRNGTLSEGEMVRPKLSSLRMGMIVASKTHDAPEGQPSEGLEIRSPFRFRRDDGKEFTLYLSVAGKGSPSQSAASIASMWHGLKYVHDLARWRTNDVIWLDFTGEYSNLDLALTRLRIRKHSSSMKRFFKSRVKIVDISESVTSYLRAEETILRVREIVARDLDSSTRPIVIVSGWDEVRRSTPQYLSGLLVELVIEFVNILPVGSHVVWFARPVPLANNSLIYETRCVAPFYSGSCWQYFVDEIIWNLPMPPHRGRSHSSGDDHIRLIVHERPGNISAPKQTRIEALEGWGEAFRSERGIPRISPRSSKTFFRGLGSSQPKSVQSISDRYVQKTVSLVPRLSLELKQEPRVIWRTCETEVASLSEVPSSPTETEWRVRLTPTDYEEKRKLDGRMTRLLPLDTIAHKREYRDISLGIEPPKKNSRPLHEDMLSFDQPTDSEILESELAALRQTIRFLKSRNKRQDWGNFFDALLQITTPGELTLLDTSRAIGGFLETHELSSGLWSRIWDERTRLPYTLSLDKRKVIEGHIQRVPDILLITGNDLFLLLLAVTSEVRGVDSFTFVAEELWRYLQSWHLQILGFSPHYHGGHRTGMSVFDRFKTYHKLRSKARSLLIQVVSQQSMSEVKYGHLILTDNPSKLWVLFQTRPGSHEMNAILLSLKIPTTLESVVDDLSEFILEKPIWGESDLTSLSDYARIYGPQDRLQIMVALQRGTTGFWYLDENAKQWIPIGRVSYNTRRYEDVTLLRAIVLKEDGSLKPIHVDDVRTGYHDIAGLSAIALLTINKAFEGCMAVKCKLSLDSENLMYCLTFFDETGLTLKSDGEELHLPIRRTASLLEILRRPSYACKPVLVDKLKLVWNRFADIVYDDDTKFLRPWVERGDPFGQLVLKPPPLVDDLDSAVHGQTLELEPYHDASACPLKQVPLERIRQIRIDADKDRERYAYRIESPIGQPDRLSTKSGMHHGSCWAVRIRSRGHLSKGIAELEEIRMKDSLVVSLLRTRELTHWSEEQSSWVSYDFSVYIPRQIPEEFLESRHVREFVGELTEREKSALLPGSYLEKEGEWNPYFLIDGYSVQIGLEQSVVGEKRAIVIEERGISTRPEEDVQEFLQEAMDNLLENYGMVAERRLSLRVKEAINLAIETSGVRAGGTKVLFDRAIKMLDEFGGERVHIEMIREDDPEETFSFPIGRWLHEIGEDGIVHEEDIRDEISAALDGFNVDRTQVEEAVKVVITILKREGIKTVQT